MSIEIPNALSAAGVVTSHTTPGSNAVLAGSIGIDAMTRVSAGVYRIGLARKIVASASAVRGVPVVVQQSGTVALARASVLPTGDANAGDILLETFSPAAGTALDVDGNWSVSVLQLPTLS